MSHWGNVLREGRKTAGLTQEELAAKVGISVSYIRKMETGLLGPPNRAKAESLAAVFNITDLEKRNAFFRAAEVGNDEDMQRFRLVKVEGDEAEDEEQGSGIPTYSAGHPAISIKSLPSGTTGGQIERLIAGARLTEEQEEVVSAALIEMTQRFLSIIETQHKMRKED